MAFGILGQIYKSLLLVLSYGLLHQPAIGHWMLRDAFPFHDRPRTRRPKSLLNFKSNGLKTDTISLHGICSTILLILFCEARSFCGFDLLFLVQRLVSPRDDFTMTRLYERCMEQKRLHYDTSVLWSVSGKRRLG